MNVINFEKSANFFRLFGNENRLRILMTLFFEEKTVSQIVELTNLSQSLVSQQLKLLKSSAVLSSEKSGKTVIYRISDEHILHLMQDVFDHLTE